jgi:hypothetical protein
MEGRDAIRAHLVSEKHRQHLEVEWLRRDMQVLTAGHRANPDRVRLSQLELRSGELHDAQAVESYIGRTLAAYPDRTAAP